MPLPQGHDLPRDLPPASGTREVEADFVYLATGFEMDQRLYEQIGVTVEGEERRPVVDPATMESVVPGVYVVGTAVGGNQRGYKVFITTSHEHCTKTARALARCEPTPRAVWKPRRLPGGQGAPGERLAAATRGFSLFLPSSTSWR